MRKNKFPKIFFIIPFLISSLFFLIFHIENLKKFELTIYDWKMKFIKKKKPSGNISIIFVGDETLKLLKRWPLSRDWYGEITNVLKEWGAKVIVYDILFPEPSENKEEDLFFSKSLKNAGNVLLPYVFNISSEKGNFIKGREKILLPIPLLEKNIKETGFINCPPDIDGIKRRYPLFIEYMGKLYPSLGVASIKSWYGISNSDIKIIGKKYAEFNLKNGKIIVPVDTKCCCLLNFYYEKDFRNYSYSFIQVLQSYLQEQKGEKPLISPSLFKNKIVIIGHTAHGTSDISPVSGSSRYLNLFVHASFIENFFNKEFIKKISLIIDFIIGITLSFILTLTISGLPILTGLFISFIFIGIFLFFSIWIFSNYLLWIETIPVIFILIFTYISVSIYQFIIEKKEKIKIKAIFEKYSSPALLDQILNYPKSISLGGERKFLTILFADIKGFTSIAENLSPEETVEFLNKVLNIMVEAVFKFKGTLDKFIGDAIMAIYGAPIEEKNHAKLAILSAIEMNKNLEKISTIEKVSIGIGINTGYAVIGNIGTEKRMEYTAIGDTVNLASRIQEEASSGEILIGEETYKLVKDEIECEFLGYFNLKGKKQQVKIYKVNVGSSQSE